MTDSGRIESLLLRIAERLESIERQLADSSKELYNSEEAARFLGVSVSRLSHLSSDGDVSYYQCNGKYSKRYYKREDLVAYCTRGRVSSADELRKAAATYCVTGRHA